MGTRIAVKGCTLQILNGTGSASITTLPSSYVKIDDKGVYRGELTVNISGFQGSVITEGTGIGTISANAKTTKVDNELAVLEGASGEAKCLGTNMETGEPGYETANFKITAAGQNFISEG